VNAELSGGTGANSGLGNAPIWPTATRYRNSFSLNGVDTTNLFNGKSTSQVPPLALSTARAFRQAQEQAG